MRREGRTLVAAQTRLYHPALSGTPPEEGNCNHLGGCSRPACLLQAGGRHRSTTCIHAGVPINDGAARIEAIRLPVCVYRFVVIPAKAGIQSL